MKVGRRLTVKNPDKQTFRLPMHEEDTMSMKTQMERTVYYGSVIDRLGQYEELGSVEEIKEKLEELERRNRKTA